MSRQSAEVSGSQPLPAAVERFLVEKIPGGLAGLRSSLLQGDASDRQYVRLSIHLPDRSRQMSYVLMRLSRPWTSEPGREELPFANIARHLSQKGIPVPRLLVDASREGAVLLEDVGDCTLEAYLRECTRDERRKCYLAALEILVRLQKEATQPSHTPCYALSYAFDPQTFFRELCFFREHAIEGLWRRRLPRPVRTALDQHFWELCEQVASLPQAFTHRDYHARNLMVQAGCLRVLDFQDARLGPVTYDLASLLRDSYVRFDREEEDALLANYREIAGAAGLVLPGPDEFTVAFRRTAVQRNLKAIGTFAYQCLVRKADRYLESIPNTLASLRRAFDDDPGLGPLRGVLQDLVEGF